MTSHPIARMMWQAVNEKIFPGAVLLVGVGDAPVFFEAFGRADIFADRRMQRQTVFDLASLTKPLATTLAVARLVDAGLLSLDGALAKWLPMLRGSDKAAITPRQLLSHRSGLPAHRLFYMTLKSLPASARKAAVLDLLRAVPLESAPGTATCYSDLGFMLLCRLVETVTAMPLDRFLAENVYGPMGIADLFFLPLAAGTPPRDACAATELCPLRGRLLVGEVHDDNAWAVGGVDGHAGLFGTAEAVFRLLRRLVAEHRERVPAAVFSASMLDEMLVGDRKNNFSLGFDRPAAEKASAGRYFSKDSVGHLGFTGVSFWMDLGRDVTVILLTNRVHPFRWRNRLIEFRPRIHDAIMEHFGIQTD